MKLKDLKEWGGRDLPGFGDEATWGGRSPDGGDDRVSVEEYIKNDYVSTADLNYEYFFVDPGEFDVKDTEEQIMQGLKNLSIKVTNDTGHPFATAFMHAIKPVWNFCCAGEDRWIAKEHLPALAELVSNGSAEEFTITQLQALSKKWLDVAQSGPNTLSEIRDALYD